MAEAARAAGMASVSVAADKDDAVATVVADLGSGDVVLVKASRGLALNTVADDISTSASRVRRPLDQHGRPVDGFEDPT